MKRKFIILVCLLGWLNSCHKRCMTPILEGAGMKRKVITDTAAQIITFEQGSNFTKAIDSTLALIGVPTYLGDSSYFASFRYNFSNSNIDYMIRLLPTGAIHKVSRIWYGDEKNKSGCSGSGSDVCSWGYNIDDTIISMQENLSTDGSGSGQRVNILIP